MKNTIITSISALVFLVIGLLIGKSNKQIEIQTVLKTNIVEKPVEKLVEKIVEKPVVQYVNKYITNVVEKVIQAEIPSGFKIAAHFMNQCYRGESLHSKDGLKLPFTESLHVKVFVSEDLREVIFASSIKEKVELEIRKAGIKIDDKSNYSVFVNIQGFQTKNKLQYIYQTTLEFNSMLYLYDENIEKGYNLYGVVWKTDTYGLAGKDVYNQKYVYDQVSEFSDSLINKLLESKERHSKPK
jgi:hypothetical protein